VISKQTCERSQKIPYPRICEISNSIHPGYCAQLVSPDLTQYHRITHNRVVIREYLSKLPSNTKSELSWAKGVIRLFPDSTQPRSLAEVS